MDFKEKYISNADKVTIEANADPKALDMLKSKVVLNDDAYALIEAMYTLASELRRARNG